MAVGIGTLIVEGIATLIGAGAAAGAAFAATTVIGTITWGAIVGATVLAGAAILLGSILMPHVKAQDGQLTLQQAIPFRRRFYGRAKLGGYFVLWMSKNGTFYAIVVVASQQSDGIEEYWLGDRHVQLDGSGNVTSVLGPSGADPNQFNPHGDNVVQVFARLGAPGQAAVPALTSALPGIWTSGHVGNGITDVTVIQKGVKQQDFSSVYPGGVQAPRVVARGALIRDAETPSDPTKAWRDDAVSVIQDYLTDQDGWRIATSQIYAGLGAARSQSSAVIARQLVSLHAGGTEERYRIWGFYSFDEEPRAVLAGMLAACGGWLTTFPDGTIGVNVGAWVEPTFTISDEHITGFDIQHWPGEFDVINQIKATFTYPANDYQDTDAVPWEDAADIARRGYAKANSIDARFSPSFTQTRRIQKIAFYEANPEWSMTLTTDAYGFGARGQRFINWRIDKLGISGTARITAFSADIQTGVCTIGIASFGANAYDWDPATEEGAPPPIPPSTASDTGIETPTGLNVSVETGSVNGSQPGAFMLITCDAPTDRHDLTAQFEYQPQGGSGWSIIAKDNSTFECQTGILAAGYYNVRVSFWGPGPVQSNYAEEDGVGVSVNPGTPPDPASITANPGSPAVDIVVVATMPNSPQAIAIQFYRGTSSSFGSASPIGSVQYGAPNQALSIIDTPSSGTWYYWAKTYSAISPPTLSGATGPASATI